MRNATETLTHKRNVSPFITCVSPYVSLRHQQVLKCAIKNQSPLSNQKGNKAKRHRHFDTKTDSREPYQNYQLGTVSNKVTGGGGLNMFYGSNLTLSY